MVLNGLNTFWEYMTLGVEHIWTGYDHLLFLLAVIIGTGTKWDYLKILTSFTIGHSITLALAALDVITISASIIEPLIALSIVIAAGESMIRKSLDGRWMLTLLFGFVHGFGFAGILKGHLTSNFALALFSFNLGVEIGQVIIVSLVFPLLWYTLKKVDGKTQLNYTLSAVSGIVGLYWFVERVFLQ